MADVVIDPVIPQGAYAEYIRLPETNVMPKPAHLSWEEAASIPENFLTGACRAIAVRRPLALTVTIPRPQPSRPSC